jgi:hypothetical protein
MGEKSHLDFGDSSPENSLMHADSVVTRKPDFSGWATKSNLQCSDGRTILDGAFKHQDKAKVPLVWQHGHDDSDNVLGHAILEHKDGEGVYCYGYFNETQKGKNAKELVKHEDIDSLSIFANKLVEKAKQVSHGIIREVSLVLARANPGALIDNLELQHADGDLVTIEDEAVIYTGEHLKHGEEAVVKTDPETKTTDGDEDDSISEVYNDMSDEQKEVVHFMVGAALEASDAGDDDTKGGDAVVHTDNPEGTRTMKRNVFEKTGGGDEPTGPEKKVLSHDDMRGIAEDAVRQGSLKAAVEDYALKHGIDNIDILFPDARTVTDTPEFDKRRTEWVANVLGGVKKQPFSRIKSIVADITHDEARARGYIKGTLKKEEFFGLVKRITTPSTVYKKQKLERDDIIDITDFDVVVWLKSEMRLMLDEEIARAILIGDGRAVDDDDKIKDPQGSNEGAGIRSILHDDDLYAGTLFVNVGDAESSPQEAVEAVMRGMELYKGSGQPTFYTTLGNLTWMLLAKDTLNRRLWRTASELAAEMGVSSIQTVEVLDQEPDVLGIIVALRDYSVGTDRGGDVTMFDDFDIDYNQYKYLIETRLSGALTKIRSALILKKTGAASVLVVPAAPTFDPETSEVTVVDTAGVVYKDGEGAVITTLGSPYAVVEGELYVVTAEPEADKHFANNVSDEWSFRGTAGA